MTFEEAKTEYAIRYYLWAKEETRLEVERGFPLLKRFDISICRKYLRQIFRLPKEAQYDFAQLLTKRCCQLVLVGETLSNKELAEIKKYAESSTFMLDPAKEAFFRRQLEGDVTTKLNRKRFKQIIKEQLIPIFGLEERWGGGGTWRYVTPVEGLRMETYIDTGGRCHQLSYFHRIIFSGSQTLEETTSALSWLGLTGGSTSWDDLEDSKAEATAQILAEVCAYFLKIAPKLLKGLADANETRSE
jgi:hypothetical protein